MGVSGEAGEQGGDMSRRGPDRLAAQKGPLVLLGPSAKGDEVWGGGGDANHTSGTKGNATRHRLTYKIYYLSVF